MASVAINCISTICGAQYNIVLDPSGASKGANSGIDIVFTNLDPNTTYKYTATLTGVSDIYYAVSGTVIVDDVDTMISDYVATTSPNIISSMKLIPACIYNVYKCRLDSMAHHWSRIARPTLDHSLLSSYARLHIHIMSQL